MSVSDEIIKVIDDLAKRLGIVLDWTNDNVLPQITEIVEGIVLFNIFQSIFLIAFSFLLCLPLLYVWRNAVKCCRTCSDSSLFEVHEDGTIAKTEVRCQVIMMFGACSALIGLFIFCENIINLLAWMFASEYKIIELISNIF